METFCLVLLFDKSVKWGVKPLVKIIEGSEGVISSLVKMVQLGERIPVTAGKIGQLIPETRAIRISTKPKVLMLEGPQAVGRNVNLVIQKGSESGFYNSHLIRETLETRYPARVSSTTVPHPLSKNVRLAGQRHPVSDIVFDGKGFPIFDDVAKFQTIIEKEIVVIKNPQSHMRAATRDLRNQILKGRVDTRQFTEKQLKAIQQGKAEIPDFTWHHHQDIGRMQLIPYDIHKETGHVGGINMWYFEK